MVVPKRRAELPTRAAAGLVPPGHHVGVAGQQSERLEVDSAADGHQHSDGLVGQCVQGLAEDAGEGGSEPVTEPKVT
jgi:hypothetical protein